MNVIRPTGIPSHTKLPVLTWIYGGGFLSGQSSDFNGTGIVAQSVNMVGRFSCTRCEFSPDDQTCGIKKEPVIYVSLNYRVNALGFLASKEMEAAANAGSATLNAGLYDIRLALRWVQENIGQFGGDKNKVR